MQARQAYVVNILLLVLGLLLLGLYHHFAVSLLYYSIIRIITLGTVTTVILVLITIATVTILLCYYIVTIFLLAYVLNMVLQLGIGKAMGSLQ